MKNKNDEINNILNLLKNNDAFLLTSHQDPDGDSVGSLIGLNRLLKNSRKKTIVYSQGRIPEKYAFINGEGAIKNSPQSLSFKPQVAIVLECPAYERIGFVKDLITPEMTIVNIDHHNNNSLYGKINYVDTGASAVGEVLCDILKDSDYEISAEVATPFFAAIASDTGGFKFANTNAKCLRTAADLVECGANPKAIADKIFTSFAPQTMRLMGHLMENMELFANGKICVLKLSDEALRKTGAAIENSEGIIDGTMTISGVQVGILFKEFDKNTVKVSLRSQSGIDVFAYTQTKGGGGHPNAAGFTMPMHFDEAVRTVVSEMTEYLNG